MEVGKERDLLDLIRYMNAKLTSALSLQSITDVTDLSSYTYIDPHARSHNHDHNLPSPFPMPIPAPPPVR